MKRKVLRGVVRCGVVGGVVRWGGVDIQAGNASAAAGRAQRAPASQPEAPGSTRLPIHPKRLAAGPPRP